MTGRSRAGPRRGASISRPAAVIFHARRRAGRDQDEAVTLEQHERLDGFGLSAGEQEQVWELWGRGESLRAVARALGRHVTQVRRYVSSTGGRRPAPRQRASSCLSVCEREEISRGVARGESCRKIAVGVDLSFCRGLAQMQQPAVV